MRDETITGYLEQLADRVPAPGGGAVAALHAAQAAALLAMAARYTDGPRGQGPDLDRRLVRVTELREEADELRDAALRLAEEDAHAYGAVATAYGMPKDTVEEQEARERAIANALAEAVVPPAETLRVAERLVELSETLLPLVKHGMVADVGGAAEAARAAGSTARLNVRANVAGVGDEERRVWLTRLLERVDGLLRRADAVTSGACDRMA